MVGGLTDPGENHSLHDVVHTPQEWMGTYPRWPVAQLLPAGAVGVPDGADPWLPADPLVLPRRVSHIKDKRGKNFVVEYAKTQTCLDGTPRKNIWYRCRRAGIIEGAA